MKSFGELFGGKSDKEEKGVERDPNPGKKFIAVPSSLTEGDSEEELEGVDENQQIAKMTIEIGKLKAKKERVGLDSFESERLDFLENKLANIKESRSRRLQRGG
mgnify:CR=1 FL=1